MKICPSCRGTGRYAVVHYGFEPSPCPECEGDGCIEGDDGTESALSRVVRELNHHADLEFRVHIRYADDAGWDTWFNLVVKVYNTMVNAIEDGQSHYAGLWNIADKRYSKSNPLDYNYVLVNGGDRNIEVSRKFDGNRWTDELEFTETMYEDY